MEVIQDRKRVEQLNNPSNLSVWDETLPLRRTMMWGNPGAETVVALMLPPEVSCFLDKFDVIKSGQELTAARELLRSQGVEVIELKDNLADMIGKNPNVMSNLSFDDLRQKIISKAQDYNCKYERFSENEFRTQMDYIDYLLKEDVKDYGEEVAISVNQLLTLDSGDLPLANIYYMRDQSSVAGDQIILSNMRHPIRQHEVRVVDKVLMHMGMIGPNSLNTIHVSEDGRLEGGDLMMFRNVLHIGVGGRTNSEGVMQVAQRLAPYGIKTKMIYDKARDAHGQDEMSAMHLDTYMMFLDQEDVVGCEEELETRVVYDVDNGQFTNPRSFMNYLTKEQDLDLIPLTRDEQEYFASNFLNLGNRRVALSISKGNDLAAELWARGYKVFDANLEETVGGYGAFHCANAGIVRY